MTDKSDSIGKIAYEAAADTTRCFQSWSEANQPKWEAAAEAVQKHFIEQACDAASDYLEANTEIDSVYLTGVEQAIRDKFEGEGE